MKKLLLLTICLSALCFFTGCATSRNGFSQFYQDRAGAAVTNLPPYSGSTKLFTPSASPTNDLRELYRNGYFLLGVSAFQGPPQSENALMSQAKKVGADVVLNSYVYLGSQQTTVPWIQYQPGQSYTTTSSGTVNANAWGSGGGYAYGTGNYYGTSTTTSPGTFNTQMIPVTVQRYQYEAAFFRKTKPRIFGALVQPLPSELRETLQRNTGVVISVVINDSPAFIANALEGDVVLKMNGEEVTSVTDYYEKTLKLAGQKVDLEVWRKGETKIISAQFNNKPN
jgi:serine protease Do